MRFEEKKDKQTNKNRKARSIQAKKGMHIGKKDETKPHLGAVATQDRRQTQRKPMRNEQSRAER